MQKSAYVIALAIDSADHARNGFIDLANIFTEDK